MDDNVHFAFELESGKVLWREGAQSTIASPVLADGKLFAMANNGNTLLVLKAGRESREELGRATVRAQWVPSPCIAGDRLVLRMKDRLKCWSLAP
jgi:outer membrane protein assembly factor BamB